MAHWLEQEWAAYDPQAACGQQAILMQAARGKKLIVNILCAFARVVGVVCGRDHNPFVVKRLPTMG